MKYHRLGCLNNRHLFLTVLEAGKSKVKVLTDSVLGEGPPPEAERGALMSLPLLVRALIPSWVLHPHDLI